MFNKVDDKVNRRCPCLSFSGSDRGVSQRVKVSGAHIQSFIFHLLSTLNPGQFEGQAVQPREVAAILGASV